MACATAPALTATSVSLAWILGLYAVSSSRTRRIPVMTQAPSLPHTSPQSHAIVITVPGKYDSHIPREKRETTQIIIMNIG